MLKRDWKLERLRSIEVLSHLPKRTLRQVCGMTTLLQLPAGKVLWEQGDPAREAYLLLDGEIELTWSGTPFETVRSGAVVGGLGVDTGAPRVATGTTLTPVEVLVLNRAEYRRLLNLCPEVAGRVAARHRARLAVLRTAGAAG